MMNEQRFIITGQPEYVFGYLNNEHQVSVKPIIRQRLHAYMPFN